MTRFFRRRRNVNIAIHTEGRPGKTKTIWCSINQGERPQKIPTLLSPPSGTLASRTIRKQMYVV